MNKVTYTFAFVMAVVTAFTLGYTSRPEAVPEPIQIVNYTADAQTELVQSPDGQFTLEIYYPEDLIEEQGAGARAPKLQGLQ